jgi:hypothetical protein
MTQKAPLIYNHGDVAEALFHPSYHFIAGGSVGTKQDPVEPKLQECIHLK